MQSVRNAFRKIYEPGTAFLLEGHENPSNLRRAIAYGGDIGGSLILAPLIAGTGASIGGALYNTAVPEPMEIPAQTLADLASLAAMGYGGYRALNRFNNAGGWQGLQGKFGRGEAVGREQIVSPAPVSAPVPPLASAVIADPREVNPNSNDFSGWDDPPSAPPFLGIPQPSPAPAPAPVAVPVPAPAPAPVAAPVGVVIANSLEATPGVERNLRNIEALDDPAPFSTAPASANDFEAIPDPLASSGGFMPFVDEDFSNSGLMPFGDEDFSNSGLMPFGDEDFSNSGFGDEDFSGSGFGDEDFSGSGFSPFQETAAEAVPPNESMKTAVIVDLDTVFEKPPYVSQADWDSLPPDIQRTVAEQWFNSSPAEQERLAPFPPSNWGIIKGI